MKVIISFFYILIIMSKAILAHIKSLPISDLTREMANFIGSNQKLARTQGQINFLLDCRSLKVIPSFISYKTAQLEKSSQNLRVTSQITRLQQTILNEEIKDAFRKKAFLQRSMTRSAHRLEEGYNGWPWLHSEGKKIFIEELAKVRQRLSNKLTELCRKAGRHNFDLTRSKIHRLDHAFSNQKTSNPDEQQPILQERNDAGEDKTDRKDSLSTKNSGKTTKLNHTNSTSALKRLWHQLQILFLSILSLLKRSGTPRLSETTPITNTNTNSSPSQQLDFNTSGSTYLPDTESQPRLVNLSDCQLSDSMTNLLSKGPRFALSQRVTPSILQMVEVGIERACYGLKWKNKIETNEKTTTIESDQNQPSSEGNAEDNDGETPPPTLPRPFFPDSGACQPPQVSMEIEQNLQKVKSKILSLFQGVRKTETNISKEQREELDSLSKNENIIVKRSDKCKSIVIMNKEEYVEKSEAIVGTYEEVSKNPTVKVEEKTKDLMKKTLGGKIPDDYLYRLLPQHTRTAEFYGLPKTHKSGNPLRPIVSACGDPLDKLSWFLQCILTQLLSLIPAHLPNTDAFLAKMKSIFPDKLPPGTILFSLDVCNLYGSIPISEGIDAVIQLLDKNIAKVNMFGTSLKDVRELLSHVLSNNYVRFGSKTFKQTSGIAMGNRVAPPVAISFMHILETGFMANLTYIPTLYVRYIDDIFGVWTHGIDRLNHFF